jgi:formylglycine-generating enzyme required for sulfatase activity
MLALVGGSAAALVAIVASWKNEEWLKERVYAAINVTALTTARERLLKPKDAFRECAKCPEMIVVPAGSFTLGWGGIWKELPLRSVTFKKPFAISKFEVTFEQWTACVVHGRCDPAVSDQKGENQRGWHSVGNLSWNDTQIYVKWLSRITGRNYRLLAEDESEYAVRTDAVELGGWQMFEDCWHENLEGAPSDGSPWIDDAGCSERVGRVYKSRVPVSVDGRTTDLSFRVGRTLSADATALAPDALK